MYEESGTDQKHIIQQEDEKAMFVTSHRNRRSDLVYFFK